MQYYVGLTKKELVRVAQTSNDDLVLERANRLEQVMDENADLKNALEALEAEHELLTDEISDLGYELREARESL